MAALWTINSMKTDRQDKCVSDHFLLECKCMIPMEEDTTPKSEVSLWTSVTILHSSSGVDCCSWTLALCHSDPWWLSYIQILCAIVLKVYFTQTLLPVSLVLKVYLKNAKCLNKYYTATPKLRHCLSVMWAKQTAVKCWDILTLTAAPLI